MKITIKQISCLILASTTIAMVGCTTQSRDGRSTGQYIDDRTVARSVKSALNKDTLTEASDIQVESFRGNVHLTGFVQHPVQKQQASKITRRVGGVQYFKNDIIVQNEVPSLRATQGQTIREPSGTEIEGSSEIQSDSPRSGNWERGDHAPSGSKSKISEPSGAEAEIKAEGQETKIETETKTETETEVEKE